MNIEFPWGMIIHTLQQSRPTQTQPPFREDTEDREHLQHQALPLHCLETSIPASGNSDLTLCDGLSLCDFRSRKSFHPIKLRTLAPAAQSGSTAQVLPQFLCFKHNSSYRLFRVMKRDKARPRRTTHF